MSEHEIAKYVILVGYLLVAARFVLAVVNIKRLFFDRQSLYLSLFCYSTFAFLIASFEASLVWLVNTFPNQLIPILKKFEISDTFFLSPLYYLNEILFLGLFFSKIISGKFEKYVARSSYLLFILEILNSLFGEGYRQAQKVGSFSSSIFIIILCILFFRKHFKDEIANSLAEDSLNLIVWGFFSISSFSILILFFSDKLFADFPVLFYQISIVRMAIEIMGLLLITYGVSIFKTLKTKNFNTFNSYR